MQRQKEIIKKIVTIGQRLQLPQTLINYDFLEKIGTQLVKSYNTIAKDSLVN